MIVRDKEDGTNGPILIRLNVANVGVESEVWGHRPEQLSRYKTEEVVGDRKKRSMAASYPSLNPGERLDLQLQGLLTPTERA